MEYNNKRGCVNKAHPLFPSLFRLQVGILFRYINDARTVLVRVQVVVSHYHSAGVARMQFFEKPAHGLLLLSRSRVGGLTTDVQTTLVTKAYRVLVVVRACYMAVGADHPFWSSFLNASVTTDDVVVADAELEAALAMPRVYLCYR